MQFFWSINARVTDPSLWTYRKLTFLVCCVSVRTLFSLTYFHQKGTRFQYREAHSFARTWRCCFAALILILCCGMNKLQVLSTKNGNTRQKGLCMKTQKVHRNALASSVVENSDVSCSCYEYLSYSKNILSKFNFPGDEKHFVV